MVVGAESENGAFPTPQDLNDEYVARSGLNGCCLSFLLRFLSL
jgi:hypothetical protein